MHWISLHRAEDNAIGRKELTEKAFEIGITFHTIQDLRN